MIRRISPQRHGQSELLIRGDNQLSSFNAITGVSEGAMDLAFDPVAANANTFVGPGKFGKMFPQATPFRPDDAGLTALAQAMIETTGADVKNDSKIPAGFTYLGQFIDHDITFDKTEGLPLIDDPATIEQARTPNLDLDSLYGFGPGSEVDGGMFEGASGSEVFKLGRTRVGSGDGTIPPNFPNDLNRRAEDNSAIIPDPRNDENLVVAQTHLAFLKFHNKLISVLPPSKAGEPSLFERAKELVTLHYQWIVLHDFLKRLVQKNVFDNVLKKGRKFFKFESTGDAKPFMPLEFSVAAYRLGHSMIRADYDYNRVFNPRSAVASGTLRLLFTFTGSGGGAPIPSDWIIDWRRFHEVGAFGGVGDFKKINNARKIDTKIADPLKDLIVVNKVNNPPPSLAERNLLRGSRVGLPTAQERAQIMKISALSPKELGGGSTGKVVKDNGFDKNTPLWFYILKEAEVKEKGERLGALGSQIVVEVFLGLLEGDPNSFISKKWKPADDKFVPKKKKNEFTMADLLSFVGELSPIDGISS